MLSSSGLIKAMWEALVIRDVSAKGKASESAAEKRRWTNGWKNQKGLTRPGEKPYETT
jgi:hypothetical protein